MSIEKNQQELLNKQENLAEQTSPKKEEESGENTTIPKETEELRNEKTEALREDIASGFEKKYTKEKVSQDLQEKMDSFEDAYNSAKISRLVNKLNPSGGKTFLYEFDEVNKKHLFLKKRLFFGYKNVFDIDEAQQLSSFIDNSAEILSLKDPAKESLFASSEWYEGDLNKRRVIYSNLESLMDNTMKHIRSIDKN